MKARNILLSTIILGGFFTPVITSTVAQAATIKTEVKPTSSKENIPSTNDQIARDKKIKLNEKFDLNNLDENTTIVIPTKTADDKQNLDDIYLNLDAENIKELKANKKITVTAPTLKTHSNWGGNLNYENSEKNINLNFDEANGLTLDQGDHLKLVLKSGDSLVHYVFKDTGEEIYKYNHEDAYETSTSNDGSFEVDLLGELFEYSEDDEDIPLPIGHFDAWNIDFEALTQWEPLNGFESGFQEEPINIKFDRNAIGKENTEYTVYLEKAKPYNMKLEVFLDGEPFDTKELDGLTYDVIDEQKEINLPDSKKATLDTSKTVYATSNNYFPQFGTTSQSGSLLHKKIFDRKTDGPRVDGFWNQSIGFFTQDADAEEENRVMSYHAGMTSSIKMYYTSNEKPDVTVTKDVEIKSNLGPQIVKNVTGKKGETITVPVPHKEGYTVNKETVQAHVNDDNTITTDEEVIYSKIDSGDGSNNNNDTNNNNNGSDNNNGSNNNNGSDNSNGSNNNNGSGNNNGSNNNNGSGNNNGSNNNNGSDNNNGSNNNNGSGNNNGSNNNNGSGNNNGSNNGNVHPEEFDGFVATMKHDVTLYSLKNNKMTAVTNRALSKHSDWKSNGKVTINGVKYYRVATNEWVKASDVYRYEAQTGIVDTKNVEVTKLFAADTNEITNRGLAANTSWKYDRIAYLGNNEEKHFRVATHEFVHHQHIVEK